MTEQDDVRQLRQLIEEAAGVDEARLRAAVLAELHRRSAWALRDALSALRAEGVSWRELAADLGVPVTTLHRQYESGRRLVLPGDGVGRPGDGAVQPSPAAAGAVPAVEGCPVPAASLDHFVARERELADLRPLLARNRLVSAIGPAGVGKTRLISEFVREIRGSFPAGQWWVDLAPLTARSVVSTAVGAAVAGGGERTRTAVEVLAESCAAKPGLLVLDNCEHLTEQCAALVAELLSACARLRVLVTSRAELRAKGEVLFPVAPLAVPAGGDGAAVDWAEVYAWERPADAGELDECQDRMTGWLYQFVQRYMHEGDTEMEDPWLRIGVELENLHRAVQWTERHRDQRYAGLAYVLAELWRRGRSVTQASELLAHMDEVPPMRTRDRPVAPDNT